MADPRDFQHERPEGHPRQCRYDVALHMPVDFANEAKGYVKVVRILPARAGKALHRIEQGVADFLWRTQGNEKAALAHGRCIARGPLHLKGEVQRGCFDQFDEI